MKKRLLISIVLISAVINTTGQNSLFKKYPNNPIIKIGATEPAWRSIHAANAAIMTPGESPDGKWRIYIRGSGNVPDYHDQIGILYQDTINFSPYGPWLEYQNNPVLGYGIPGSYDEWHLLDCSPVIGENGNVHFYYKAVNFLHQSSLAGAKSFDGGFTFHKYDNNPLKLDVGANDVIYYDNKYHIFYGDALYNRSTGKFDSKLQIYLKVTSDPEYIKNVDSIKVIGVGGGPDEFDSEAVNGARIFRLDSRWYMIYQGSNRHFDYPDRFHAAYSDDLINWIKIENNFSLMTRGDLGEWDQGGIWYGEVFQYQDTLYMLYEGWGCDCIPVNRDEPYFEGGNSRTGISRVSVNDFLLWSEGGFDSSWVSNEFGPDGTIADFENYTPYFHPTNNMTYEIISNPAPGSINSSAHCGKITTTADQWELLWSEPFSTRFEFTKSSIFKMKVYSTVPGNVYFKIEYPTDYTKGQLEVEKYLSTVNQWVEIEFDFSSLNPQSGLYGKIVLLFDAGGTNPDNDWYFDDIKFEAMATSSSELVNPHSDNQELRILSDFINQNITITGANIIAHYDIYSIDGVIVKQGEGDKIDIRSLSDGVYIITYGNLSAKFIKH